jgi:hypothetical protein
MVLARLETSTVTGTYNRAMKFSYILTVCIAASLAAQEPVAQRPRHIPPATDTLVQVEDSAAPAAPRPNCWRASPRPPCDGFFLTEIGVDFPVFATRRDDPAELRRRDFGARFVWGFGVMGTRGRHSHGGVFSFGGEGGLDDDFIPHSLEYRYRNWLGQSAAVDAGIGYRSTQMWKNGAGLIPAKGVTAMVAFTPSRWIAVSARGELVRAAGRERRALLVGVQSTRGSEFALRLTAVLLWRAALQAIGVDPEEEDEG